MTTWKFKPYTEDDTRENPTQSQFFTIDQVDGITNGLIREGIQNALDEQLVEDKPVIIRITISGNKTSLNPNQYKKYINGLIEHLKAKDSGLREIPDFDNDKMNFLVFEDFNTKGLRGNANESKDADIEDQSKPHNFYYFWRNIGITGKSEDKLGRWGIGKTVFPASSKINTFWGYTIQSDTKQELLLGQSILRKHNLNNKPEDWGYKPYGYYGIFDQNSYFAKPIEEQTFLKVFKEEFNLTRKNEPGLSLIVPFFQNQIKKDILLLDVIKQYFFPILNNNLVIEIKTEEETTIIDKVSIFKIVDSLKLPESSSDEDKTLFDNKSLISLFNFTKWAIELKESDYYSLVALKPENQPRWDEKLWQNLDLNELQTKFELEKKIAFKVPIKYHSRDKLDSAKICWFKVFLERDENLKKAEDHFIRENITIIDVKSLQATDVRGIVLIEDKDLANLLGDSENPAHTQWQEGSQNFINKYFDGDKCLAFIKKILNRIYIKLQKPATGYDKDILKDWLYLEDRNLENAATEPDDDSSKDNITERISIDINVGPRKPRVKIRKIDGGVTFYSDNENVEDIDYITARFAYMTTRGKPLNKYEKYDFELNKKPIEIFENGCTVKSKEQNKLEFSVKDSKFELTLKGFDIKRDLYIKLETQFLEND